MQFGFTLKPDHTTRAHAGPDPAGRGGRLRLRLAVRLARAVARAVPPAHPDGPGHDAAAPGHLRDQPGDPRADRHRLGPGRPRRDVRRADGPRHRAGRLGPPGPRQAADHDGPPSRRRSGSSGTSSKAAPIDYEGTELQLPWTGSWTLPVWVAGYGPMALAMTGRIADGIILQLADPDLIRWFVGQVRESARGGRPRPVVDPGPGRGAGLRRPTRAGSRADALVPGARLEPRRRPRQQVPARAAAGQPDRLRPRPDGLRLPPPRRGRLVQRRLRRRRGDRPVLRPRLGRRPHRQAARARRRRRRPVQHLPDERRRGGPARGLRPRHHPGPAWARRQYARRNGCARSSPTARSSPPTAPTRPTS